MSLGLEDMLGAASRGDFDTAALTALVLADFARDDNVCARLMNRSRVYATLHLASTITQSRDTTYERQPLERYEGGFGG